MSVADLAASGVLEHGRNRQRLAEAAGLPMAEPDVPVAGPLSSDEEARERRRAPPAGPAGPATGVPLAATSLHDLVLAVLGEPRRLPRLDGEDGLQAQICLGFDVGTRAGRWAIVPVILRNDIRVRTASEAELGAAARSPALVRWHQKQQRQAWREAGRAKAMGLRPGAPDLLLLTPGDFGFLEVKSPGEGLRPEQRAWRDLCAAAGWHHGVARSWSDALAVVRCWGWA